MRKQTPTIEYNPSFETHGYRGVRWVENVSRGLRRVGFADEVAGLNHKGWFTEDDGDNGEVYRGVVYQLPTRHDELQFVYGHDDPNNADSALLCFDVEHDKSDAARAADSFAEIMAEEQRDYSRAWQAGRRYESLDEEVKAMRKEALDIGAEMRAARGVVKAPTICAALRDKVKSLYRAIQKARKERAELLDNFGTAEGWKE